MSYFDQKFRSLRNKIASTYVNEETLKFVQYISPNITAEYLPFLTVKLFEVLDSLIDEVKMSVKMVKKSFDRKLANFFSLKVMAI